MIETGGLINVYSDMNPWIDYVISVDGSLETFNKAKEIVAKAFDKWFTDEETNSMTMADWIGMHLGVAGIRYDFYYKEEKE